MNAQEIKSKVSTIIESRKERLVQVDKAMDDIRCQMNLLNEVRGEVTRLASIETEYENKNDLKESLESIDQTVAELEGQQQKLEILHERFSRNTINIGVSGEARVGKSLTLQKLSGLTDTQIPTGAGLPVTAVRSEIYNTEGEGYAEVTFRTEEDFINDFVQPHMELINRLEHANYAIPRTIKAFSSYPLVEQLSDNASPEALNSLVLLKEAQTSVETFRGLLGSRTQNIPLPELRQYVAYPTSEERNKKAPARKYLAVRHVNIHCKFPALEGIKMALIDLPGLGEIDATVAESHTRGLEDNVDHILLVVKANNAEGYFKKGINDVVSNLQKIQPAISERSDLITFANNIEAGTETTARMLADDIDMKLNDVRRGRPFDILGYDASNADSVQGMMTRVLEIMGDRLPLMDQQVFDDCFDGGELNRTVRDCFKTLQAKLTRIKNSIPIPDELMLEQITAISKNIINSCNAYEVELNRQSNKDAESTYMAEFKKKVQEIADDVDAQIKDGLFLGKNGWKDHAKGQPDYYNFYRDECRRIRKEIIESYCGLDIYYTTSTDVFKTSTLNMVLDNLGGLRRVLGISESDEPDKQIAELRTVSEVDLGPNNQLKDALSLLDSVAFSFRNNVFLQISTHLEELSNPQDDEHGTKRSRMGDPHREVAKRIESTRRQLIYDASKANNNIKAALLNCDDRYNEYLSVCISFFNDYLFRRNQRRFEQLVVRGLLQKYGDEIVPGRANMVNDRQKARRYDAVIARIRDMERSTIGAGNRDTDRTVHIKAHAKKHACEDPDAPNSQGSNDIPDETPTEKQGSTGQTAAEAPQQPESNQNNSADNAPEQPAQKLRWFNRR